MKYCGKFVSAGLAVLLMTGLLTGTALAQSDGNGAWLGGLFAGAFCLVWVVMFIIWIGIGIWMYKDAEKRGKNGALWLIIGLVLGIIGLIIWLIVRPSDQEPRQPR